MLQVLSYTAYYSPGGNGIVEFKLSGEPTSRQTALLGAQELNALLAVLQIGNATYDPVQDRFSATR